MRAGTWVVLSAAVAAVMGEPAFAAQERPPAPPRAVRSDPGADRRVNLNLNNVPLRKAVEVLFHGSGRQYAIEQNVPDVPINLQVRNIGVEQAFRLLVRLASARVPGLTQFREGDVFVVAIRRPAPASDRPPGPPGAPGFQEEVVWEKIPLAFQDAAVVAMWLGGTVLPGPDALFRTGEAPLPARGGVRALPPGVAPAHILPARPAAPATPARSGAAGAGGGFGSAAYGRGGFGGGPFAEGGFGGSGFGGGGFGGGSHLPPPAPGAGRAVPGALPVPGNIQAIAAVPAANALLVRGTPDAIQELKSLIRLTDVPARQVHVRLSTGRLGAQGRTFSSVPLQLTDASAAGRLSATVTPRVNGDGTVTVAVDGSVTTGGVTRPFRSAARVIPGQSVELVSLGAGARPTRIWVRASVLPDPAR